ncbi:MAG: hypothetical protein HRT61_00705 [Ekhidna sp.]|nr:hypothetical protein [Ekhidna sp.]
MMIDYELTLSFMLIGIATLVTFIYANKSKDNPIPQTIENEPVRENTTPVKLEVTIHEVQLRLVIKLHSAYRCGMRSGDKTLVRICGDKYLVKTIRRTIAPHMTGNPILIDGYVWVEIDSNNFYRQT